LPTPEDKRVADKLRLLAEAERTHSEELDDLARELEARPDPETPPEIDPDAILVHQEGHDFVRGDILRKDSVEPAWVRDPEGGWICSSVVDRNSFYVVVYAQPPEPEPEPEPPGEYYAQENHGFRVRDEIRQDGIWHRSEVDPTHVVTEIRDRNSFKAAELVAEPDPPDPGPGPDPGEVLGQVAHRLPGYAQIMTTRNDVIVTTPMASRRTVTHDQYGEPCLTAIQFGDDSDDLVEVVKLEPGYVPPEFPHRERTPFELEFNAVGVEGMQYVQKNTMYEHQGGMSSLFLDYGRFQKDDLECMTVHIEREEFGEALSIVTLSISNGARDPNDLQGEFVDGDVKYHSIRLTCADDRKIILPFTKLGRTRVSDQEVLLQASRTDGTPHFWGIQHPHVQRFAIAGDGFEAAAMEIMHNLRRPVVKGESGFETGGYGPQRTHCMDMDDVRFEHTSTIKGWEAMVMKSFAELNREHKAYAEDGVGSFFPRGRLEGNEPGGWEIQVGMGSWCDGYSHTFMELQTWRFLDRSMAAMFHHETGWPLDPHDFAQPSGHQPWNVNRTEGSSSTIPWSRNTNKPWSQGTSLEEAHHNAYRWFDHAHSCRQLHGLKYLIYRTGSVMAQLYARTGFAHYQFDPSPYEVSGYGSWKTLPGFERAEPRNGNGALGRQMGWPLDWAALNWEIDLGWNAYRRPRPTGAARNDDPGFRERNRDWFERMAVAMEQQQTPAGGFRVRYSDAYGGNRWSWASPPPDLPDNSPLGCSQVFEDTYMFFGLFGCWKTTGFEAFETAAKRLAKGYVGSNSMNWGKFVAVLELDEGEKPNRVVKQRFLTPTDVPGNTGKPHMVNMCAMAYAEWEDEAYFQSACRWLGFTPPNNATKYQAFVNHALSEPFVQSHGEVHDWRLIDYWNNEAMVGLCQAR
jgi:hypothetical protein